MRTIVKSKILLLLGCLFLAATSAVHAQLTYTDNGDGTCTLTGYGSLSGDVIVPETLDDLTVTSIGPSAFDNSTLTSVALPDTVTNIGTYAFSACYNLTTVTMTNGVTSIGPSAFSFDNYLTNITIPDSVTNLGEYAFEGCSGLTNINVPAGLTGIKHQTFASCSGLQNVSIPNGVTNIDYYAFSYCGGLTNVTLPFGVATIGDGAFQYCSSLTNLTIPNSVLSIGAQTFYGAGLTSVMLPASVTSLGIQTFYCPNLTNITVSPSNSFFSSLAGVLFDKNQATLVEYPVGLGPVTYTVPDSVTTIGAYAFIAASVTNVITTDHLTSIAFEAFDYCPLLTNITLGKSITSIADEAFIFCNALTNVTIPGSVTYLGEDAFAYCPALASVTIGHGVANLANDVFYDCDNLRKVYFSGNAPADDQSEFATDSNITVYYLPGTTGWTSTYDNFPTARWPLPYPLILDGNNSSTNFGLRSNGFGFTVSWATNLPVIVQVSTNLAPSSWQPLQTNTLTNGTFTFTDPTWTNYPARYYRLATH